MLWLLLPAAVLAGYGIGRYQPGRRASDWAHWQTYRTNRPRHDARWWAVWTVLSAENLAWIITHPIQARHAWKHRNDPPPPRSPAPKIEPDWAAKRRAAAEDQAAP